MDRTLTVKNVVNRKSETYSFRFQDIGWAFVLLDNRSGTVAIHSDYGDFSYSWPPQARGECTLKEFLCHGDYDYLARKFCMGRRDEYDPKGSVAQIKSRIRELRRERDITKDEARGFYDEIEAADPSNDILFNEYMSRELSQALGGEPWGYFKYEKPQEFLWLKEGLLPAIVTTLRKEQERPWNRLSKRLASAATSLRKITSSCVWAIRSSTSA